MEAESSYFASSENGGQKVLEVGLLLELAHLRADLLRI